MIELVYATITGANPYGKGLLIEYTKLNGARDSHKYTTNKNKFIHAYGQMHVGGSYIIITEDKRTHARSRGVWVWTHAFECDRDTQRKVMLELRKACPTSVMPGYVVTWEAFFQVWNKLNGVLPTGKQEDTKKPQPVTESYIEY